MVSTLFKQFWLSPPKTLPCRILPLDVCLQRSTSEPNRNGDFVTLGCERTHKKRSEGRLRPCPPVNHQHRHESDSRLPTRPTRGYAVRRCPHARTKSRRSFGED